jgi:hypothetical protein
MAGSRFDTYAFKARYYPALLTILSPLLALLAWRADALTYVHALLTLAGTCGGTFLLSELGRELGKRKEPALLERWGGWPTTVALRHRHCANHVLRGRRHALLVQVCNVVLPTADEEHADLLGADAAYRTATVALIERTRDTSRFGILQGENRSYGFRRNLWGLKVVGLPLSVISLVVSGWAVYRTGTFYAWTCASLIGLSLPLWIFVITPTWIKIVADAYAERLFGALEVLVTPPQA